MAMTSGPRFSGELLQPPPGVTRELLGVPVTEGRVPDRWPAAVQTPAIAADADRLLVSVPGAAAYISHGNAVVVESRSEADRLDSDYIVYAVAARALLWQRRRFSLHATLVAAPGGPAVAVTGSSMAGKSTTTMALVRRGWPFACDDIVQVDLRGGVPIAVPCERPVHLSDAAARLLNADPAIGRPLPGRTKRVYSMVGDLTPRPLAAIVRLRLHGEASVEVRRLVALESMPVLAFHSDPHGICQLPGMRADYLRWTAGLASVPLLDVARPAGGDTVWEVADAIEQAVDDV
jgi:hypothetical protein